MLLFSKEWVKSLNDDPTYKTSGIWRNYLTLQWGLSMKSLRSMDNMPYQLQREDFIEFALSQIRKRLDKLKQASTTGLENIMFD